MTDDPATLAAALVAVVRASGAYLREAQPHAIGQKKADGSYVAIDARTGAGLDASAEQQIQAALAKLLPGAAFLGEEGGQRSGNGAGAVIVDPLDGTAPYLQRLNFYAVSLLVSDVFPRAAILHQPSLETWLVATFADGPDWAANARWFRVGPGGAVEPGRPPEGPNVHEPVADSYLDVSSDVHRRLELTNFGGKLRARGATASGFLSLVGGGGMGGGGMGGGGVDPRAVAVTRAKIWDVAAGLVLAEAIGLCAVDLRTRTPVDVAALLASALAGGDARTPPMVVGRPGDPFLEGIVLR